MIVAVSVNHSGPYDFLLDTGTQFSMIDPTLATELHVKALQDSIPVAGMGFQSTASTAQLDYLAIGSYGVANLETVVYNLQSLRSHDLRVRGILGEERRVAGGGRGGGAIAGGRDRVVAQFLFL